MNLLLLKISLTLMLLSLPILAAAIWTDKDNLFRIALPMLATGMMLFIADALLSMWAS